MRWVACARSSSMWALLGSVSRAAGISRTTGGSVGLISNGAACDGSSVRATNCGALSECFSEVGYWSTGRACTVAVLTSAALLSAEELLSMRGVGVRAAIDVDHCGPKKPLNQRTVGTTIISPAISPTTADPTFWRTEWSSSKGEG